MKDLKDLKIAVVGLGYVGLPLAVLFSSKYPVVGFDINSKRVAELKDGHDQSGECPDEKLAKGIANGLTFSDDLIDIVNCNVYVVAVPTPVDKNNQPLLTPLDGASRTVGKVLKDGDIVIYESTVYPGITEDFCAPILEQISGKKVNVDFYLGYSPERINPSDRQHTVNNITKVTSGSTPGVAKLVDSLYDSVLDNGTCMVSCIRAAEACKILENSQRDVNIAFMNEISKIFKHLGINTNEVLRAACTKWNFLPFRPGLVGGHCISVDPYYLIQRAQLAGYTPKLMQEARNINDTMGFYVAEEVTTELNRRGVTVRLARVLVLGFTFKENCRDIRNTKVADVVQKLTSYTPHVTVYDPWADAEAVKAEYGVELTDGDKALAEKYDAVVYAVCHKEFEGIDLSKLLYPDGFVFFVANPAAHTEVDTSLAL